MKLVRVDSVAIGAFNAAIPTPPWYFRLGILDPSQGILTDMHPMAMRFTAGELRWTVLPGQFLVELSKTPIDDVDAARPGAFLSRTLENLPHTPMTAVGNNVGFELEEGEPSARWQRYVDASTSIAQAVGATAGTTDVQLALPDAMPGARVTLVFSFRARPGVVFNVHRFAGSAEEAIVAANSAGDDFHWAKAAIGRLVNGKGVTA
jgi:hypothetical protein